MKNFLWGGMSGVGGYKFNFKNSSEWNISVVQVKEHNDNRIVINNRLNDVQLYYKDTSIKIVIKLTGVEENNSRLKIYDDIDSSKEQSYNKDGIYEIDYIANDGANYVYFYITGGNYGELDLPITIEQLPLYPGATEEELTKIKDYFVKTYPWLFPDQNTVNAICSDGRIYSKDWKESIYNEETESTSKNLLTIGYSGNSYTKIAFKNLAIYPTVLSKEDCIKAYNYLQTLKAK